MLQVKPPADLPGSSNASSHVDLPCRRLGSRHLPTDLPVYLSTRIRFEMVCMCLFDSKHKLAPSRCPLRLLERFKPHVDLPCCWLASCYFPTRLPVCFSTRIRFELVCMCLFDSKHKSPPSTCPLRLFERFKSSLQRTCQAVRTLQATRRSSVLLAPSHPFQPNFPGCRNRGVMGGVGVLIVFTP
jgi:hypothetical protein